jgi:hypothetical protein
VAQINTWQQPSAVLRGPQPAPAAGGGVRRPEAGRPAFTGIIKSQNEAHSGAVRIFKDAYRIPARLRTASEPGPPHQN